MRSKGLARACRLLLGFLLPPVLGAVLFLIYALGAETNPHPINIDRILEYLAQFHVVVFFAMLFAGLPSLAFSIIVEFVVRPRIIRRGYFMLTSCILGGVSGFIPGVLIDKLGLFVPMGMLVGIFVGLLLYDQGIPPDQKNA